MKEDNINLIRRKSGGGAVYFDENKIAGLAYNVNKKNFLYNVYILVNADISKLPFYLTPNKKK